jgi:hypothetical protein
VIDGPGRARFTFDDFPLLEGVYDLSVAISDHTEVHDYDNWDKRIRFEVHQTGIYDEGIVAVDGSWHIEPRLNQPRSA